MWLQKGIPYLNQTELRFLMKRLNSNELVNDILDDRDDRTDQIFDLMENIKDFIDGKGSEKQVLFPFNHSINHLRNYALLKRLRQVFPDVLITTVNGHLMVTRIEADGPDMEEIYRREEEAAVEFVRGVSRVIEVIIDLRKTIVGHNMMVDLLFIYEHLVDHLPPDLNSFKQSLKRTFPVVFDTKAMFHDMKSDYPEFRAIAESSSGVNDLFKFMSGQEFTSNFLFNPVIELISENDSLVEHTLKRHDAGSDSYATGCVFIRLSHALLMMQNPSSQPNWINYIIALDPYVNRVNLIRAATHHVVSNLKF